MDKYQNTSIAPRKSYAHTEEQNPWTAIQPSCHPSASHFQSLRLGRNVTGPQGKPRGLLLSNTSISSCGDLEVFPDKRAYLFPLVSLTLTQVFGKLKSHQKAPTRRLLINRLSYIFMTDKTKP